MDFDQHKSGPGEIHVSIRPADRWSWHELRALWEYRELLLFLTWRDIKVKYRQTTVGLLWVILQPVATMLIFSIFFGRVVGIDSGGLPYPLFAFSGIVPWLFFSNSVNSSSNSLVGSSNLITKVYFPRMIIPGAAVLAGLVDFLVALVVVGLTMAWFGVTLTRQIIFLPFLLILTVLLTFGIGLWMAALNVRYRDVRHALPFILQLWMFATPIIYPTSLIPPDWRRLINLNPLTGLIDAYRAVLLGRPIDWSPLLFTSILTMVVLVLAAWYFRRTEEFFADIV
ncbi:MAG: ABC transporter permease [Acidobacteriota bacterium]|jgi:lipopolysaccharide transport system permease protein